MAKKNEGKKPNGSPNFHDFIMQRTKELQESDHEHSEAFGIATLEGLIREFVKNDHLKIQIYGDFTPPKNQVSFETLGIIVHPQNLSGTGWSVRASTILEATVQIADKSLASIVDAIRRINILLGSFFLLEWGNVACGWWSVVTHGPRGGVIKPFNNPDLESLTIALTQLPKNLSSLKILADGALLTGYSEKKFRRKVGAALYWLREPTETSTNAYRDDVFRRYAGYWNAFECLVDAIALLNPQNKLKKQEKEKRINEFLSERCGKFRFFGFPRTPKLELNEVQRLNRIVEPGLLPKAKHVLRVCFPVDEEWEYYVTKCFESGKDSLYDIRNTINHGEVDVEDPRELVRIETKGVTLLWLILRMFACLIPFSAPVDPKISKHRNG